MFIHVKVLNNPALAETELEVSAAAAWHLFETRLCFCKVSARDTIQDIKARIFERLHIPVHQQKLVLKGRPLHDGSLEDNHVVDGAKLHLILSATSTPAAPAKPANDAFLSQLQILAAKWLKTPQERDAFVSAFQRVSHRARLREGQCMRLSF